MELLCFDCLLVIVGGLTILGQGVNVLGQASHAGRSCSCNSGSILDLQERLFCLEQTVDQLSGSHGAIKDCSEIPDDGSSGGVYKLSPRVGGPFDALCVFDIDGKWTVVQQRFNGNTEFNRIWVEYQHGFGTLTATGNFWLGLDHMHEIIKQKQYTLRVDLTDWDGSIHYAEYLFFYIGDEASKYAITLRGHSGNLPDALIGNSNGTPFTTNDQDNDSHATLNCAANFQTGWWHTACYSGQVNGPYRTPPNNEQGDPKGIIWHPYTGSWYSMKASRMRIKPTYTD